MIDNSYFSNIASIIDKNPHFFDKIAFGKKNNRSTIVEPRTRDDIYGHALSMEVFDPLWLLTRQWQYGRFQANDCGTPVTMKVKTIKKRLDGFYHGFDNEVKDKYSNEKPIEYLVEEENRTVTIADSVDSALRVKKKLSRTNLAEIKDIIKSLIGKYPLDNPIPFISTDVDMLKLESNESLKQFYSVYKDKIFDGSKLYTALVKKDEDIPYLDNETVKTVYDEFVVWYEAKYFPCGKETKSGWNMQSMSYSSKMSCGNDIFKADDYDSGQLSWYSYDHEEGNGGNAVNEETKMLSYIPTPANIHGAPSSRLWAIENTTVNTAYVQTDGFSTMANAAVMLYVSSYNNDWMVTPLETEAGVILDIEGVVVKDTFGEYQYIHTDAEDSDYKHFKNTSNESLKKFNSRQFIDRWNLFGNTRHNAYEQNNFSVNRGLFFPSSVMRNEERVIEEVQFLRDEMANMVWGVEKVVPDLIGNSVSGDDLSDRVLRLTEVEKKNVIEENTEDDILYSYLIQNNMPLNWIPFVSEAVAGSKRSMQLRRGRMPLFYKGVYLSVRPSTSILLGNSNFDLNHIEPMVINEEEVLGYGVKLTKTAQRTRWFLGKSFNWIGVKKSISKYQSNSGLMFDELIEKCTGKAISLNRKKSGAIEETKED